MKTILCISLLIGWSCLAEQTHSSPKPELRRLAEKFERLRREPPRVDAKTLQKMEAFRLRLDPLQAERARKAQEERLRQKDMEKPGDYWIPGELDRWRKRTTTGPKE